MFEDEMTEKRIVRTMAEYRRVTRQEIREQRIADERALTAALHSEAIARLLVQQK